MTLTSWHQSNSKVRDQINPLYTRVFIKIPMYHYSLLKFLKHTSLKIHILK